MIFHFSFEEWSMTEDSKFLELRRELLSKIDDLEFKLASRDANMQNLLTDFSYGIAKLSDALMKLKDRIG